MSTLSNLILKISSDWDSTMFLERLFQSVMVLTVKKFFIKEPTAFHQELCFLKSLHNDQYIQPSKTTVNFVLPFFCPKHPYHRTHTRNWGLQTPESRDKPVVS